MELIVVGFHRSGTSLLAQLLHRAGLFVGDDLLGALPSNPHGHFEDREVLELHREILADNGTSWQMDSPQPLYIGKLQWERMQAFVTRRQLKHRIWGFKEPQVCLFLGAWKFLMPDSKFVIIYRDPGECVRSMESRQAADYFSQRGPDADHLRFFREPDHGLKLWDVYNRAVLAFARSHIDDCLVIPYSRLAGGYPVVRAVNRRLRTRLRNVPTEAVFMANLAGRRGAPQAVISRLVEERVARTWHALEELAVRTEVFK